MMKKKKLLASISLDLDDKWSYMKVHGDPGWEKFPSYLDIVLPITLDVLDRLDIKITFFIVGQDAAIEKNHAVLKMIVDRGHEVANHSFHHESWLKTYSKEKIEEEIVIAEEAILKATGKRTNMFRGPGFSWSNDLLEVLEKRNYIFDASLLPTYISPLMRKYYFWKSKLSKDQKNLLEIPVTTMPVFKIPFHQSYLIYINNISGGLMKLYLRFAIMMCKITRTQPSYLLHPLDLLGSDDVPELAFFPGMNVQSKKKVEIFETAMNILKNNFELLPMGEFAARVSPIKTIQL